MTANNDIEDELLREEEALLDEELEELQEYWDSLPIPTPGRNDPCLCGSGKKYKNCCLKKHTPSGSLRRETITIKKKPLTSEELKETYLLPTKEDQELLDELYSCIHNNPEKITSDRCNHFKQLKKLVAKYPDNPTLYSHLAVSYQHLGDNKRVEELIEEMFQKFPDYLFARTAKAGQYLNDNQPEKAFEMLKRAYTIQQFCPDRTVFHISEVVAFANIMIRYCCQANLLAQAELNLQILQQLLDKENPLLKAAESYFKEVKVEAYLKLSMSRKK